MHNQELARIFNSTSAIYQYLGGQERFRALAYQKAARVIAGLNEDVEVYIKNNTLKELPGIGERIAGKIEEFIKTGKIKKYEQLKKTVPFDLLELLEIKGFGPQSLKRIHDELKVTKKTEIIQALQDGKVEKMKGFGRKKVDNMLRGLKLHKTIEDRMLLWDALEAGEKLISWVKNIPETKQAALAGSLRRGKETIGDIDLLVSSDEKYRKKIIEHFTSSPLIKEVLAKGNTKVSVVMKDTGRQADLRIVNADEWGSALQYFTGSKEHNIHLRKIANEKGYKISEYGIFLLKNNKKVGGKTEEEIYSTLGFTCMPPEMREDKGEIDLAAKNKIPKLISLNDIKGDLHMHSVWSDGVNSIEEIATFIIRNFKYEYIVMTDHSKSSRIAKGMDEKQILKQLKAIDEVNKKLGKDFVKKGIEVDILADGTLDVADEILSQLDWVTASIHSGFNHDNTERIIAACTNPYVSCIGHPTGRLIGTREPYKLNLDQIITAAKETGTSLEINTQPDRMDLNDQHVMMAREKNVKLVMNTDAHAYKHFDFMKLGIFIARRAWCTAKDILNTHSWDEIRKFTQNKKKQLVLHE